MHKSVLLFQRCFRGMAGRNRHWERSLNLAVTMLVQRAIRGFFGRSATYRRRQMHEVQVKLAKKGRGKSAHHRFNQVLMHMSRVATTIQCFWRKIKATGTKNTLWKRRFSCIVLQRVYRGHWGRYRAQNEHEKYMFSRSHSSGIELARQMLSEYKLHAAKLQSEIALLSTHKSSYEEQVDAVLNDISQCEQSVRNLENQMHQLSHLEKETAGVLPGKVKDEVREQKIRLDKDFSEMLTNISDRRDHLQRFEERIGGIEKSRQEKHDELRELERKLVELLEAQQSELFAIRRQQEKTHGEAAKSSERVDWPVREREVGGCTTHGLDGSDDEIWFYGHEHVIPKLP